MMAQQQQQQYVHYAAQPVGPGATVYTYSGAQQPRTMAAQPGAASTTAAQNKFDPSGSRAAVVLASIQLAIACCCIGFQSTSTHLEASLGPDNTAEFLCTGIWCGILFLVTGALGLGASKRNSPRLIITFMVMNILSSLAAWTLMSFAAMNTIILFKCRQQNTYVFSRVSMPMYCNDNLYSVWNAMDIILIPLAVTELIITVVSAVYCCKAVCCCCRSNPGVILQQAPSGAHMATTERLPPQQRHQPQAMGVEPHRVQGSYTQYSVGQASYAQPGQAPLQQQQPVPVLPAYLQAANPQAANPQAAYPHPQAAYPQAAYPQAGYPQHAYPQAAYHQAAYPQAAYPQAAYPQAAYPQAAYPQAANPQAAYPQAAYSPYATASAIPGASGQSGVADPGQAHCPSKAGNSKPVAAASEPPPSYDTVQKL